MSRSDRLPYNGTSRKLILAFDVGTTFSGISYCILDPGQIPEVKGIVKFPDQETIRSDAKVPSIIWYGPDGDVKAIGAGAVGEDVVQRAEDEGWYKSEWFKLQLRPASVGQDDLSLYGQHLPGLPPNKSIVDVFSDYFQYLRECARVFIEEHHLQGEALWKSLENTAEFVLTHPNGWEGEQQNQMRRAAILGGLISDTQEDGARVHFVTEGEASLHFCVSKKLGMESLNSGHSLMVVDAGGGTVDISTYNQRELSDGLVSYQEVSLPQCHLRGSVFVSQRLRIHLNGFLESTPFYEDISHIVDVFDKAAKLKFKTRTDSSLVKFGCNRDNLEQKLIRRGTLKLEGPIVAKLFEMSVDCIADAIKLHKQESDLQTVFLVGGFAANDWLFHQLKETAAQDGISVCRPDSHVNKAVTDGAVVHWIDRLVSVRKARHCYGVQDRTGWRILEFSHIRRVFQISLEASGAIVVPGRFFTILTRGTPVLQTGEFRSTFTKVYRTKPDEASQLEQQRIEVLAHKGQEDVPYWVDQDPDNFREACVVIADTTVARKALVPQKNFIGMTYYQLEYDVVLLFGNTEFKAQIAWKEDGVEKRSPAVVIYEQTKFDRIYQPYNDGAVNGSD